METLLPILEGVSTFLLGLSILLVSLNFILAIIEIATICTIHAPKRQTFADIRVKEEQFQTIIAPAMGALISGLLVSISASFLYSNLVNESKDWYRYAGIGVFFIAALSLVFTINLALRGGAQAAELARNPFTIRAAAEEFTDDPRHCPVDPDTLSENLKNWTKHRSAHSLNVDRDIELSDLDEKLDLSARLRKFSALPSSFIIYLMSIRRVPFRFVWPLFGPVLFLLSVLAVLLTDQEFEGSTPLQWWKPLLIALLIGVVSVLFYGTTRGNRARLWHRVNQIGQIRAEAAVSAAKSKQDAIKVEDERLKRVLLMADKFLESPRETAADKASRDTETENAPRAITIGRFYIEIRRK
ncbi:hypothetical protein [Brevibacterium permense]|uniref:hypothetical protein n=1 Tax=Brevibacterium permense TaxID=234834 RepID=UPI0021CF70B1|nr:hypothetical protein [Brevibacterium permense]